ncbi:MAG: 2-dehydropantoate 2-reductase [Congregibacter sp.]
MQVTHNWHVLGAGAMGTLLCQRLRAADHAAVLVHHRSGSTERLLRDGSRSYRLRARPLKDVAPRSVSRLLLTTKAGQLEHALALAVPYLRPDAVVATTANGLGYETALSARYPELRLYRAVSTAAAYRESSDTVIFAAEGQTRMGLMHTATEAPAWFTDSLGRLAAWTWECPIDQALGRKFALNCVINPLTATMRCRNGDLLHDGVANAELSALCAETEPVLRNLGLWQGDGALLTEAVRVCAATANNQSSMLQDVLAGRETEIAYLNAELLRRTLRSDVELPLNQMLCSRLGLSIYCKN